MMMVRGALGAPYVRGIPPLNFDWVLWLCSQMWRLLKRTAVFVAHYPINRAPAILQLTNYPMRVWGYSATLFTAHAGKLPSGLKSTDLSSRPRKLLAILRTKRHPYELAVAFEPHGFYLACMMMPPERVIYYSLELFLGGESGYPASLEAFTRRMLPRAGGVIIQSQDRLSVLHENYDLPLDMPTYLLPVCLEGGVGAHDKPKRNTALHLGGLTAENGIPALCEHVPEGWNMLLHGHGFHGIEDAIRASAYPRVTLSDSYFDSPEQAEELCKSATAGLAWYGPNLGPNYELAARSSGKIAAYLKHGLPIIARNTPSFAEALNGCGVLIDKPDELPNALAYVDQRYEKLSLAAHRTFMEKYDFINHYASLGDFLTLAAQRSRTTPQR